MALCTMDLCHERMCQNLLVFYGQAYCSFDVLTFQNSQLSERDILFLNSCNFLLFLWLRLFSVLLSSIVFCCRLSCSAIVLCYSMQMDTHKAHALVQLPRYIDLDKYSTLAGKKKVNCVLTPAPFAVQRCDCSMCICLCVFSCVCVRSSFV